VSQFSQVVQQQNRQIEKLQAKVDKKKQEKVATQQMVVSSEQTLLSLQNQVIKT